MLLQNAIVRERGEDNREALNLLRQFPSVEQLNNKVMKPSEEASIISGNYLLPR
jgi:hypothetical protein